MKINKPKFEWCKEDRQAICTLYTDHGEFKGVASCHPDDEDMMSEKVGFEIALNRAIIKSLVFERENRIKPSLKALKQLYYSMKHSKNFNKKSYEAKMLWGQIQNWQFDLDTINEIIDRNRKILTDYINTKEALYQNIRNKRNSGQN